MQKILLGIIGVLVVVGIIAYLVKSNIPAIDTTPSPSATSTPQVKKTSSVELAENASNTVEVAVTGENYTFTPKTITVKEGQKVRVTFTSKSGLHDFVLDEFNAKTKRLQSGSGETIEFTATKKGTFTYYCSVGNHRAMGMEGTLTVE